MGMAFLEETKTMTDHRERLVRVPRLPIQALSIRSIGRPRKRISCNINGSSIWGLPDSGSDVNLLAQSIAKALKLHVMPLKEVLQLADGTPVITSGFVRARVSLLSHGQTEHLSATYVDFVLLDSFRHSVLVGMDSLDALGTFTRNSHALMAHPDQCGLFELNSIRFRGMVDEILPWFQKMLHLRAPPGTNGKLEAIAQTFVLC
jgi:hypothetical protein